MSEWQTGRPPNEQLVEVQDEGRSIRVRAIYGRDGLLPHWESEDRDTLWRPSAFCRWRTVDEGATYPAIGKSVEGSQAIGSAKKNP